MVKGTKDRLKESVTLANMLSGLILQACLILSGLVVPRLILTNFGSDMNGLVSSADQFLKLFYLAEGGVTAVVAARLYKPLVDKDPRLLSGVMAASRRFFGRLGCVFAVYALLLAILYPRIAGLEPIRTAPLILILAVTQLFRYYIALSYQILLTSDKKQYLVHLVQALVTLLGVLLSWISVRILRDLRLLLLANGLPFVLQPLIFSACAKRDYPLDPKAPANEDLLKERWNGFAITFASFIHNNIDIALLTVMAGLREVSVYSVYALAANGMKFIIISLTKGIEPVIGQLYARRDRRELEEKMRLYEYIVCFLVCLIFGAGSLLLVPFVMIYTRGVNDARYHRPVFGMLLLIAEMLYLLKIPHLVLAYSANRFREIKKHAYIEAGLNLGLSLLLIRPFGMTGAAAGTAAAMLYRMLFHVRYTSRLMPGRRQSVFYKTLFRFLAAMAAGIALCRLLFPFHSLTPGQWILHAVLYCMVLGLSLLGASMLWFREELTFITGYLKRIAGK